MSRIPNLFKLDDRGLALPELNPECEWVAHGGHATRLYDGLYYFLDNNDCNWRTFSNGEVGLVEEDDLLFHEALAYHRGGLSRPWTYELVGPGIKDNPEQQPRHILIPHGRLVAYQLKLTYESILLYLSGRNMAGLVIWEDLWDFTCRKAKVRQEHFGMRRNRDRRAT